MLEAQDAGVDAIIFREEGLLRFGDVKLPMHASTQCAIRDLERARHFESLGCERVILERGLSLEDVRKICAGVRCEVEFFVHGALCVCYSGDCRLSEYIDGRSADRGECIQACRSLYDLVDGDGRVLLRKSGTEPVLRVMAEATTPEACEKEVDAIIRAMDEAGQLIRIK